MFSQQKATIWEQNLFEVIWMQRSPPFSLCCSSPLSRCLTLVKTLYNHRHTNTLFFLSFREWIQGVKRLMVTSPSERLTSIWWWAERPQLLRWYKGESGVWHWIQFPWSPRRERERSSFSGIGPEKPNRTQTNRIFTPSITTCMLIQSDSGVPHAWGGVRYTLRSLLYSTQLMYSCAAQFGKMKVSHSALNLQDCSHGFI